MWPTAKEAVKKSPNEQERFAQRRKVAEGAKRTMQLLFASLCALAPLREIVFFHRFESRGKSGRWNDF
jgi:hypothetical protein